MPDTKEAKFESVFDIPPDEAHEARLDAEAEADIAAGRVISNERMNEWLTKLANGERAPRPKV
jgi:hypothetical protein